MDEPSIIANLENPPETSDGFATGTDTGLLRSSNQDAVLAQQLSPGKKLIAVADGMGGHSQGEVASWLAVNAVAAALQESLGAGASDTEVLKEAVLRANKIVYEQAQLTSSDMGTTLTAALLDSTNGSPVALLINVGDSRAYRISGKTMYQITADHSVAAKLARLGRIPWDEVKDHPQAHILYRSIGAEEVEPDFFLEDLESNDLILLCTDGLWNEIEDEDILSIVLGSGSPVEAVDRLIQEANSRGGHDNISVIIAQA